MDHVKILQSCKDSTIGNAVLSSLNQLFAADKQLLELNASEETISAKIAQYLQPYFPNHHIDVEYNRMGHAPKRVKWDKKLDEVYPDIIVHNRGTKVNILAIEIKKDSNPEKKTKDIKKLQAYCKELGYHHALYFRLGVGENAGIVSECEWVDEQQT